MIQFFCPDVYYWEDVISAGKFVLLLLSCGLPFIPVLAEIGLLDIKLRNPIRVRVLGYGLLLVVWICCVLGLIFIPSASAIYLTCLKG